MTTRKLADGARRHYGLMPHKRPSPSDLDRKAATMARAIAMSDALKPCPFCGGEAEVARIGDNRQSAIVECTNCGCTLSSNENGAGFHWNQRADPTPEVREAFAVVSRHVEFGLSATDESARAIATVARALGIETSK